MANVFKNKLQLDILVKANDGSNLLCRLSELWQAVENEEQGVQSLSLQDVERLDMIAIDTFVPCFSKEADIVNNFSTQDAMKNEGFKHDYYLTYHLDVDKKNIQTHETVKAIARKLEKNIISVWFDVDHLKNVRAIISGLDNSRKVIVFVTRKYMEKVDDRSSRTSKVFSCAVRRKGVEI